MFKNISIRTVVFLPTLILFVVAAGCKKDDTGEAKREQEQRLFDLYMGSTFLDTIAPPTESGLYYIEVEEGTGESPEVDDWVMINYVGYAIPGDEVVDTYIENVVYDNDLVKTTNSGDTIGLFGPVKMRMGTHVKGLTEGLTMMKTGGKAMLCFTSDLGYGNQSATLLKSISSYQSLRYDVELLEVIRDIESYESNRMIAYADTIPGVDTIVDVPTGAYMYYVVDQHTHGSQINNDSVVEISYKGYLTDGRVFDQSAEGETYVFTVGDLSASTSPIVGWHRGVLRFKEGEKGRLIIPYPLAYGPEGRIEQNVVVIPAYETLVFDIEVVDVRRAE
jgi:FKBP-type peptidyl-prolyl cis-trans isomerase